MNPFHDTLPDIPTCPHCGHDGDGLEWAFPDSTPVAFNSVQCACLACGAHGQPSTSYEAAAAAFAKGQLETAA